jgi:hypothetical protein
MGNINHKVMAELRERGVDAEVFCNLMMHQAVFHIDRALDSGPYQVINEMPEEDFGMELIKSIVILNQEGRAKALKQAEIILKLKERQSGGVMDGKVRAEAKGEAV